MKLRTRLLLLASAMVFSCPLLAHGQDGDQVLRLSVQYGTVRNTPGLTPAVAAEADRLRALAQKANTEKAYGDAMKHLFHGLAIMRGQEWTAARELGQSLTIKPDRVILEPGQSVALTGTKKGCDHGQCGACTVHVNGRRVLSCLTFALMHDGEEITTIEGLGTPEAMHPMQAAFFTHDAYQCGYCTSGQIMSAVALLKEPCGPDDAAVKELMSGNICRCGAYANIVAAIQQVRKRA